LAGKLISALEVYFNILEVSHLNKSLLIFLTILFLFSVLIPNIYSQKAEKLIKIGAVDLQKVFEKSPGKKIAEEALQKKRKQFDKEKKKKEKEIQKMKDKFEKKKLTLSEQEKAEQELAITKKVKELRKFIEESNNKLEEEENKLLEPLVDDIKDVIKAVSIKYGYDMILDKSTYILYIDKEFDITDEVLKELKAKYEK